jgi:hypothetical protein
MIQNVYMQEIDVLTKPVLFLQPKSLVKRLVECHP